MSHFRKLAVTEPRPWKTAFWTLALLILVLMPILSRDYGQSGDEWVQMEYGRHIWNYFATGDQQALDYTNMSLQFQHQEYYGGFFDFSMEAIHQMMPSVPLIDIRHFFNALMGAIMMLATGLLARKLSGRWSVGLLALLLIVFSPRIFGESMNNPKDIPFACGFTLGIYGMVCLLYDFPKRWLRNVLITTLGLGIAFGVRPAGGLLLSVYILFFSGVYVFLNKEFRSSLMAAKNAGFKRLLLGLAMAMVVGYLIGLATWPYGQQAPIANLMASLQGMSNREVYIRTLFEGQMMRGNNMPWYYEFKWIMMSNPLVVIAGVFIFMILGLRIAKSKGLFVPALLLFCAFFPLLYAIYKNSTVFDTWRHMFFVYPYWVVMAALGFNALRHFFSSPRLQWAPFAIALLGLLPAIVWTFREHPNQYVYFNESVGGIRGAFGQYELDYYQNGGLQAVNWIKKNAPAEPGRKLIVLSNLSNIGLYFVDDTSRFMATYGRWNERHQKDWDYFIAYSRYVPVSQLQNEQWPPQNVVHRVEAGGVPIDIVVKRSSKESIAAYEALNRKDFEAAARHYAAYLATDTTDENVWVNYGIALASIGQMPQAAGAIDRAINLDPMNPQLHELKAQILSAMGQQDAARQSMMRAQSIMLDEQELAGE